MPPEEALVTEIDSLVGTWWVLSEKLLIQMGLWGFRANMNGWLKKSFNLFYYDNAQNNLVETHIFF